MIESGDIVQELVVYGCGGLGRRMPSILDDINRSGGNYKLGVFVDGTCCDNIYGGVPIVHDARLLHGNTKYIVAIADTSIRSRVDAEAASAGLKAETLVHPRAYIESPASIGEGCIIMAGACVDANSQLGRQVLVNVNTVIGHDAQIGRNTTLSPLVMIGGGSIIGEMVMIGAGAVVLPGRMIGDNAVVGAGSVVVRDIQPSTTVVGVPARRV